MSDIGRRKLSEEDLLKILEETSLGERLFRGEKEAFKEYFELNGAKLKSVTFSQPKNIEYPL